MPQSVKSRLQEQSFVTAHDVGRDFSSIPVLDVKTLNALRKELSSQAVRNFLRLFLTSTPVRLAEIQDCARVGDYDQVASLAHDLVSTTGNIGAMQTSCLARAVARSCRNADERSATEYLDSLAVAVYAACLAVQMWINEESRER